MPKNNNYKMPLTKDSVAKTIRKDAGFYVSALILFGYFFTTMLQIVRYAYYGVEITYLLVIRIEEILLGVFYLSIILMILISAYELAAFTTRKRLIILKQMFIWAFCCILSFALTQRRAIEFYLFFLIAILVTNFITGYVYRKRKKDLLKWIKETPFLCKLTTVFVGLLIIVILLQLGIEIHNNRFTYVENDQGTYIILTTFHEDFITIRADIIDDHIIIHRGETHLFKIDQALIIEKQFESKELK